jgi:hypothetical protein
MERQDQLLNLTQLSKALSIPYGTLANKSLPYHRVGRKGRKMYKVSEVISALKR